MGVLEQGRKYCDFCFADNEQSAAVCCDCGAPFGGEENSEESDSLVYKDLARANLQRMRGDLTAARETCLGILRRFPNNATTQGVLGDLCLEQGELSQAQEWYEMALDVKPDDKNFKTKLERVKQTIADKEAQDTAAALALPEQPKSSGLLTAGIVMLVLAIAAGAYWFGANKANQNASAKPEPLTIQNNSNSGNRPDVSGSPVNEPRTNQAPVQQPVTTSGQSNDLDGAQLQALHNLGQDGVRASGVQFDPRTSHLIISANCNQGENVDDIAARVAALGYQLEPSPSMVSVRMMMSGRVVLIADLDKAKIDAVAAIGGQVSGQQLSNIWTGN